jgi:integrase/recombinase XerD
MVHSIHLLFFLYKSKSNAKGTSPIFCRLTLNAKRKQFSTGIYIKEQAWNSQLQRVKGASQDAQHINANLETVGNKINKAYSDLLER